MNHPVWYRAALTPPAGEHHGPIEESSDGFAQHLEHRVRQPDGHLAHEGGEGEGHRPDVGGLWPAVEIEEQPSAGGQVLEQAAKALSGIVEMVEHPEAGDEVEALRGEGSAPQVGPDHHHVVQISEVASGCLDGLGAVEGDDPPQVAGEDASEPALATPGVESDLAGQSGEVEVRKVDRRERLVLVTYVVESVPLVPEAGEGLFGGPCSQRLAREVEVPGSGYLDFSSEALAAGTTEQTFSSFGYEWNAFDDIRDEDEAFAAIYFSDLDLPALSGKVGLDAGCGKGRFTRILARHLGGIVALDGSQAVEAAARNLGDLDNVVVVRSDLRSAPFAPESFDFISSLGVLHHLDDPRQGFRRLLEYLAPGGRLLLYLYSRPETTDVRAVALTLASLVRKVTVGLPHPVLKVLSEPIAALLYGAVVLPGRWGQRRAVPDRMVHHRPPGVT